VSKLLNLPIAGDARGDGSSWPPRWSKTRPPGRHRRRSASGSSAVSRRALYGNGLYGRPDDRGDVVVHIAPPLICGQEEFDEMEQILRQPLTGARKLI
jgi:adenosylmethionine-8-amino-7-oxononanoate aminotransferase